VWFEKTQKRKRILFYIDSFSHHLHLTRTSIFSPSTLPSASIKPNTHRIQCPLSSILLASCRFVVSLAQRHNGIITISGLSSACFKTISFCTSIGPLTEPIKETLLIRNPTQLPIAFKVKTTAPKQYCVRPNSGRIEPNAELEVQGMTTGTGGAPERPDGQGWKTQSTF
jgi:hypothetical protein